MKTACITFEKYHGRQPGSIGSSMIRGKWLAEKWDDAFLWTNGAYADSVIFQKVYWEDMMIDFPGKKILDLCDPDWLNGDVDIKKFCDYADHVTTSTEALAKFVRTITKTPVTVVPDRLNMDYFTRPKEHTEKARNVVWFGYYANAKEVLPPILMTLKRLGLGLRVVSNGEFTTTNDFGVDIQNVNWDSDNAWLDIQGGDIAVNPPSVRSNFRYKSNNKTLISWALGLPVANTAEDLERFIDPKERTKEVIERRKELEDTWTIEKSIEQYKEILK